MFLILWTLFIQWMNKVDFKHKMWINQSRMSQSWANALPVGLSIFTLHLRVPFLPAHCGCLHHLLMWYSSKAFIFFSPSLSSSHFLSSLPFLPLLAPSGPGFWKVANCTVSTPLESIFLPTNSLCQRSWLSPTLPDRNIQTNVWGKQGILSCGTQLQDPPDHPASVSVLSLCLSPWEFCLMLPPHSLTV